MSRDPIARVRLRPSVDQWKGDEPITLAEAVALFFPVGPLTIKSFRTAAKRGDLAVRRLAGKDWTTPRAVQEMMAPCRAPQKDQGSISKAEPAVRRSTSSETEALKSAQAAALMTVRALRERSKRTSQTSTKRPSAPTTRAQSASPTS